MELLSSTEIPHSKRNARCPNFTQEEEQLLIGLVNKYKGVIECKKSNTVSWKEKELTWKKIEKEFNSNCKNGFRSMKNLKEKYNNLKKRTKQKWAEEKKLVLQTGGGSYKPPLDTEMDNTIKDILGEQLTGLSNDYDSDKNVISQEPGQEPEAIIIEEIIEVNEPSCLTNNNISEDCVTEKIDNISDDTFENTLRTKRDWTSYTTKDLKTPVSQKLKRKAETRTKRLYQTKMTKKVLTSNEVLIEKKKIAFVNLQKEKFLEEHTLKMEILKKNFI